MRLIVKSSLNNDKMLAISLSLSITVTDKQIETVKHELNKKDVSTHVYGNWPDRTLALHIDESQNNPGTILMIGMLIGSIIH